MDTLDGISLTYFVDFVLKAGTPKITAVASFKNREDYSPTVDFYKQLREKILETLKAGAKISTMETWALSVQEKKRPAYLAVISGLKTFMGKRSYKWFALKKKTLAVGPISLSVNPEVGLEIDGVRHVIKLYLRDEPPLVKNRAQLILHILQRAYSGPDSEGHTFGVLDARKGKFHASGAEPPGIDALLEGEAVAFKTMYDAV